MLHGPDRHNDTTSGSLKSSGFERGMIELMPLLRRYARSLTRSDHDSEDLLQDCVERALVKRNQWSGSNLKAWTYSIMTSIYRNGLTKAARQRTFPLDDADHISAEDTAADPLQNRRLAIAIDALAPEFRAVLMLVVVEGMTYRETAELLQIPEGTVMSRLARARAQLSNSLQADNIIPLRKNE